LTAFQYQRGFRGFPESKIPRLHETQVRVYMLFDILFFHPLTSANKSHDV
jgi:hypothetical protein